MRGDDVGDHRVRLNHALGRTSALLVAVVGTAATWPWRTPDDARALAAVLSATAVLFSVGWWPGVVLGDRAVLLRNPWSDVLVPWSAVEDVSMGWTLEVRAEGRLHRAWGAPGPRRMRDTRDLDWTGPVAERYAAQGVGAAGEQGHGRLGAADAGMLVGQRFAARAALTPPGPVLVRPATASRMSLALAAALAVVAVVPWG